MRNEGESTAGDRAKDHRPGSRNVHADGDIVTHNTLSADVTHVEVFYPFHPLHGYRLRVLRKPKKSDGAVAVVDPIGKRLKIPVWMLSPVAGKAEINSKASLSRESLLSLVALLKSAGEQNDNLLQTSTDKSKGDRHAATATTKPGSNRRRTRNRRSSG
jgi:hypothetical protein